MTSASKNGVTPPKGNAVKESMARERHTEEETPWDYMVDPSNGQSSFVTIGEASYRVVKDYARQMRRENLRGRDWSTDFVDSPAHINRERIAREQAQKRSSKRDRFTLSLGGLLDE